MSPNLQRGVFGAPVSSEAFRRNQNAKGVTSRQYFRLKVQTHKVLDCVVLNEKYVVITLGITLGVINVMMIGGQNLNLTKTSNFLAARCTSISNLPRDRRLTRVVARVELIVFFGRGVGFLRSSSRFDLLESNLGLTRDDALVFEC